MKTGKFVTGIILAIIGYILQSAGANTVSEYQTSLGQVARGLSQVGIGQAQSNYQTGLMMQGVGGLILIVGLGLAAYGLFTSPKEKPSRLPMKQPAEKIERHTPHPEPRSPRLPILEANILKLISSGSNTIEALVKDTGVDQSIILGKLTNLFVDGYITKDHHLTNKGYEYLQKT